MECFGQGARSDSSRSPFLFFFAKVAFAADGRHFLMYGKPVQILSGSVHYFRILPELWKNRLTTMKAAGLNTVQTYVEWSSHEPEEGQFDFERQQELVRFLYIAHSLNLMVILRPGPYIGADRDFGGLPYWLLRNGSSIGLRSSDKKFLSYAKRYLSKVFEKVKPLLISKGGPVIMVQLENEYESYGVCDLEYMHSLRDLAWAELGRDVVLFTTDAGEFKCDRVDGVIATVNFGTADEEQGFRPQITSYHHDAPISEAGDATETFKVVRDVINEMFGLKELRELSSSRAVKSPYPLTFEQVGHAYGFMLYETRIAFQPPTRAVLQAYGIRDRGYVYQNNLRQKSQRAILVVLRYCCFQCSLFPRSYLLYSMREETFGGKLCLYYFLLLFQSLSGILSRSSSVLEIILSDVKPQQTLSILVENQGRISSGDSLLDPKGILSNVTLDGRILSGWEMRPIDLSDAASWLRDPTAIEQLRVKADDHNGGLAVYATSFALVRGLPLYDNFLLLEKWTKIPKTAQALLEFFIQRESRVTMLRDPLAHFCQEEIVLHAQECRLKLGRQSITHQDVRDMVENLVALHSLVRIYRRNAISTGRIAKCLFVCLFFLRFHQCIKKDPEVAKNLGTTIRKLIIITGEVAASLEKIAEVVVTDWVAVGDAVITKVERMKLPLPPPFSTFIPRMSDFKSIKMLGAGGFGAVYLANYRPVNFVATVKLVNTDRFSRQKQAAVDKVVASVIRNPFLVKYYACFCVKEAYVTIMEYIPGLDLMRVVTKEEYLEIDAVQIIMAQLILALEHMHLRGFVHRDIKVSNMLINPGGRVKVIDFDTVKICSGHFSKRLLRGYFRRTPFEFHDGESAGTIPYMAPEILKRKPYGRAADWWSAGVVMYKLMTGRVPFRGKTKQQLKARIIGSPLKWPRYDTHPHSATPTAKDMTFYLLKKNPIERLGSRCYGDLKTHPFFDHFNWQMLYTRTNLCDISGIQELLDADRLKGSGPDPDDTRQHLQMQDMTDVGFESQKPLLCYASRSFKKLMTASVVKDSPADESRVLPLDVVLTVNGNPLEDLTLAQARRLVTSSGDHVVLSIMAYSTYRLLTTRTDIVSLLRGMQYKTASFKRPLFSCLSTLPYGLGIINADVWDDKVKRSNTFYIVTHAKLAPVSGQPVYPGDLVSKINGLDLDKMKLEQVLGVLQAATGEVILTVMHLSPMRVQSLFLSKMHETAMTDSNVPSRTMGADIDSG
ncbi:hypothetical protein HPB48_014783 [Haemaphysalis longicornis]|uniref:Beta-galactosidase n=1 Tax=Haemaphysalis longicornis TaxID=44386 RepID=A0A9J6GGZ2_HAELO|nr:hypothetical protein HPB48_014783 [Haemaphysalis longicornis]